MAKSFYDVLGVSKDASADEIKSAYRKLARQYHPDLHPGDVEAANKFKEISEAYDTLSDPKKKAEYDNPSPMGGGFGGGGGFEGFSGFGGGGGSVFDSIFDMVRRRRAFVRHPRRSGQRYSDRSHSHVRGSGFRHAERNFVHAFGTMPRL